MTTMYVNPFNFKFIGRQGAIDAFHSLRSLRAQHNSLYLEAEGGLGKTRVLKKYVEECKEQLRPWHVLPKESTLDPLIDFYDFTNRTVGGLRRSIAERLGLSYFAQFQHKDNLLLQKESELKNNSGDQSIRSQIASLRVEVEQVFFQEISRALREIRNYSLLLFDTFEVVYNRRVGHWFLTEFLPNPATHGCIIVFAGRPRSFQLPSNVLCYQLKPFNDEEATEYFETKWEISSKNPESALITLAGGYPLLLDLGVHYMRRLNGNVSDLINNWSNLSFAERQDRQQEFKRSIVSRFLSDTDRANQVIQDMAHLKRRYNQPIYRLRQDAYSESDTFLEDSYIELKKQLQEYPFIKYRLSDDSLTLHDIFQEMIAEFGGRDWHSLAKDIHKTIVLKWYDIEIRESKDDREIELLRVEQLAYITENDKNAGAELYDKYFEEIQTSLHFEFNDLLWGEFAEQMHKHSFEKQIVYEKTCSQANWMFETGQHRTAIPLFEQITNNQLVSDLRIDEETTRRHIVRLGHCLWRTGQLDKAIILWENALNKAEQAHESSSAAYYSYNLGQVRAIQKAEKRSWAQAIALFKKAIDHASQIGDQTLICETLFVMARLQARSGDYDLARNSLRRSLSLIQNSPQLKGKVIEVQACVYAGDVYRYSQDTEGAKGFYQRAIDILQDSNRWPDWYVQAYAGLGAAFSLAGSRKRLEGWGGIVDAIEDQKTAAQCLTVSLDVLRQYSLESHLSICLNRLADICIERYELTDHIPENSDVEKSHLRQFDELLNNLTLVEENSWNAFLRDAHVSFSQLDILGKAQRLLEVAYLQAEKMQNPHNVLDSLVSAMRVAQKRNRRDDLSYFSNIANTLKGLADLEQEEIFANLEAVLQAHLLFDSHLEERAVSIYSRSLPLLTTKGGFGWFKAKKELPEIRDRIVSLRIPKAREYCTNLLNAWEPYPELAEFVSSIQDLLPSNSVD